MKTDNNISRRCLRQALCIIFAAFIFLCSAPLASRAEKLDEIPLERANAVYVYNIENSVLLASKNAEKQLYPASAAKIMTGLICCEHFSGRLDERVTVTEQMVAHIEGRYMGIKAGNKPTVRDLLYLAFCGGFNDAVAIMEYLISGSETAFVAEMNNRAAVLGMHSTVFTNATGVHSDGMVTTAEDVAKMALAASENGLYMTVTSAVSYSTEGFTPVFSFDNYNQLISAGRYRNTLCRGLNAGSTPASGGTAVTIAEKDGASILCVIMGGETDGYNNNYTYILASRLIDWAFENYGYIDVFSTSDAICNIPVALAMDTDSVVAVPSRKVSYYLPVSVKVSPAPGENPDADITYTYRLTEASLDAPVESGKAVGFLSVFYKGELIDSVVLVAGKSVDQSRLLYIFERIKAFSTSDFFIGALITAGILSLIYITVSAFVRGSKKTGRKRTRR